MILLCAKPLHQNLLNISFSPYKHNGGIDRRLPRVFAFDSISLLVLVSCK